MIYNILNSIFKIYFSLSIAISCVGCFVVFLLIPKWVHTKDIITPSLVGETYQNAISMIMEAGLTLNNHVEHKTSPINPTTQKAAYRKGIVMAQNPLAKTKIKRSKEIRIVLSSGVEISSVPNVIGKEIKTAEKILQEMQFRRGYITTVYSNQYPKENTVIAQTPLANTGLHSSGAVSLLLSLGVRPQVFKMPNLQGMFLNEVRTILESHGFKVKSVDYVLHPAMSQGQIVSHQPTTGTLVHVGQQVDLEVSGSHRNKNKRGSFYAIRHDVLIIDDKPKHLEIYIEDELGKRKVVDTYYESSMKIRKPYKISGRTNISIYEDGQRVKYQEIK